MHDERGISRLDVIAATCALLVCSIVGVPVVLGQRAESDDHRAKASLRHALVSANAAFATDGSYERANGDLLRDLLPDDVALANVDESSTSSDTVAVDNEANRWSAAASAGDNRCWLVTIDLDGEVRYGFDRGLCTGEMARDAKLTTWR